MKLRTFTVFSAATLSALTLFAGYSAQKMNDAAHSYAGDQSVCTDDLVTSAGTIGCFTQVIAITDETYFDTPLIDAEAE